MSFSEAATPTLPDKPVSKPSTAQASPEIPVFRNPQGNAHRVDLAEIGAPVEAPLPAAPQAPAALPKIRFNLSPNFDTFTAHGLQVEKEKTKATTLLGKIALKLELGSIFSGKNLRYAGVGLVSFAVFMFVFNFGTIAYKNTEALQRKV